MIEQIISLLGGRASEDLMLDDISTGASNDIERATKIANAMVTKYGMSKRLGTMTTWIRPTRSILRQRFCTRENLFRRNSWNYR